MTAKKTAKAKKAGTPSSQKKRSRKPGTERWPAPCVADGEFILLPKALIKRFAQLGMEPRHLWLMLALQVDRYENRAPRFYWEELALWCGRSKNTVRKWASRPLPYPSIRVSESIVEPLIRRP